jgi:hypothetical protein
VGGDVDASQEKSDRYPAEGKAMWRLRRKRVAVIQWRGSWVGGDVDASQEKSNPLSSGGEAGWEAMWTLRRSRVSCSDSLCFGPAS